MNVRMAHNIKAKLAAHYSAHVYAVIAISGLIYGCLTYIVSRLPNGALDLKLFTMRLSVALPEILIWFIAAHCAVFFWRLAASIRPGPDSLGLRRIATALLLLVLYIVLLTTADTVVSLFSGSTYLLLITTSANHLPLAVAIMSVALLYSGSRHICRLTPLPDLSFLRRVILAASFIIFSALFLQHFRQSIPGLLDDHGLPRFALPVNTMTVTYALPHLALWFLGLLACRNLAYYAAHTKGLIYKALFKNLARGTLLIYICIFLAQLLMMSTVSLTRFSVGVVCIYIVLALTIVGFVLVYRGTKSLAKLENV